MVLGHLTKGPFLWASVKYSSGHNTVMIVRIKVDSYHTNVMTSASPEPVPHPNPRLAHSGHHHRKPRALLRWTEGGPVGGDLLAQQDRAELADTCEGTRHRPIGRKLTLKHHIGKVYNTQTIHTWLHIHIQICIYVHELGLI